MLLQLLRLLRRANLKRALVLAGSRGRSDSSLVLQVQGVGVVLEGGRGTAEGRGEHVGGGAETVIAMMILSIGKRAVIL